MAGQIFFVPDMQTIVLYIGEDFVSKKLNSSLISIKCIPAVTTQKVAADSRVFNLVLCSKTSWFIFMQHEYA